MTNEYGDFIYKKIASLAKTKKFMGITKAEVNRLCKTVPDGQVDPALKELVKSDLLTLKGQLLFPVSWQPRFSEMELQIADFMAPCFDKPLDVRTGKVLREFPLFNNSSLEKLLFKLELAGKIVKLDSLLYIQKSLYDNYFQVCKELERFSIKDFCAKTSIKRDNAFKLLTLFEKTGRIEFYGSLWVYKPSE